MALKGDQLPLLPGTGSYPLEKPDPPRKKRRKAKKNSGPWVSTTQAATELGCSNKFLLSQRDRLFKSGTHYRVLNPEAWRPTYRWHLKRLQELMEV